MLNTMKIKRAYIEITNRCNLRCSFCDTHDRTQKNLTLSEFNTIIQEVKPLTPYLYLHVQGEPLLHPQFEEIMNICDNEHMQVQLVTNGTFLCDYPTILSHTSLRKLSISLHSIDFQTIDIDEYMNPILRLMIQLTATSFPYLELRFWTSDQLQDKAKKCLTLLETHSSLQSTTKPNSYKIANNIYIHFENKFEWPAQAKNINVHQGTCRGGKDMIAILVDGTIVPCCLDTHGTIHLGNIFEQHLSVILNEDRYLNLIKGFNQNKLVEPLCQQCTYRNRFTKV